METKLNKPLINNKDIEKAINGDTNIKHLCRRHSKRISSQRKRAERVILKCGSFNIDIPKTFKCRVFPDIVTVFVEARWRWTLFFCILTYISIWLYFAGVCIEIHTTIGYGARAITLLCPSAIFTMCIESIIGTITQSFLVGVVFAKLTRPKNRAYTLVFSKNAIVNQRDHNLCLTFRVGNTRKSRIISASVHAYLIRCVTRTKELGEQIELDLSVDSSEDILFMFPISAVHRINEKSPFYCMSAQDILKSELEILVVFEGTIESTGQPVQVNSSYTAQEILWGHRFVNMVEFKKNKRAFVVDYMKFNETNRVNTPLCSAKQLKLFYK